MKRHRNFAIYAGFALVLAAFLSYFTFLYRFAITRDMPWLNFALFAIGLGLILVGTARAYRLPLMYRGRVSGPILGLVGLLIAGAFLGFTFWFSRQLPPAKFAPAIGEKAPDFTLPDTANHPVTLSTLLNGQKSGGVLLVFYRGYW